MIIFPPDILEKLIKRKNSNWEDINAFVIRIRKEIKDKYAFMFVANEDKISNKCINVKAKVYYKISNEKWIEETEIHCIKKENFSEEILKKIENADEELDITDYVKKVLEMSENE